jgi:hypothetical protein
MCLYVKLRVCFVEVANEGGVGDGPRVAKGWGFGVYYARRGEPGRGTVAWLAIDGGGGAATTVKVGRRRYSGMRRGAPEDVYVPVRLLRMDGGGGGDGGDPHCPPHPPLRTLDSLLEPASKAATAHQDTGQLCNRDGRGEGNSWGSIHPAQCPPLLASHTCTPATVLRISEDSVDAVTSSPTRLFPSLQEHEQRTLCHQIRFYACRCFAFPRKCTPQHHKHGRTSAPSAGAPEPGGPGLQQWPWHPSH